MALTRTIFVAELTVAVDAAGTLQTFLFGTEGFATKPTDTPANTVVSARLLNAGTVQRELFSGARVAGAVRPSFGRLMLNNADGALDGWLNYGTSNGLVTVRWGPSGGAYPSAFTTCYVARIVGGPTADFSTLAFALQDRSHLLDAPFIAATFTGAGGREGEGVAGRRKHMVLGEPGFTPVQVLDAQRGILYVQANAADGRVHGGAAPMYHLFDAGVRVSHAGSKASWSSFINEPPAAGWCTSYVGDAESGITSGATTGPVFLRYAAAPGSDLRVKSAGFLLNYAADTLRPWRFADLLARAGIADTLATGSTNFGLGNRWVGDDSTFAQIANDAAKAAQIAWGFGRLDQPFALALKDPADTSDAADTVQFIFTKHNARDFMRIPVPGMEAPVWQVVCNTGEVWPCQVSTSAAADVRQELTRQWPYTSFSASAQSVRTAHPGANSDTVELAGRYFTTRADQRAFGERYLSLYGGRRDVLRLVCVQFDAQTLAIDLHAKVQVQIPRFGCTPARTFRVIGIMQDLQRREIAFTLWGGDAGPGLDESGNSDGTVTIGDGPLTPSAPGTAPGGSGNSNPPPTEGASGATGDGSGTLPAFGHDFTGSIGGAGGVGSGIQGNGDQTLPACTHNFQMLTGGDPHFDSVVLLLHGNGTNGSTTITDNSRYAHTITAHNGFAISTAVGSMFGGASMAADGVNDYAVVPNHAAMRFGSGPLSVDAFVYLTSTAEQVLIACAENTSGHEYSFNVSSTYVNVYYGLRNTNQFHLRLFWPSAISLSTRTRISVQRSLSGAWCCHAGGVQGTDYQVSPLAASISFGSVITGTYTDSFSPGNVTADMWVAGYFGGAHLAGNFEELRMTTAARYSGNYTVETVPFLDY